MTQPITCTACGRAGRPLEPVTILAGSRGTHFAYLCPACLTGLLDKLTVTTPSAA